MHIYAKEHSLAKIFDLEHKKYFDFEKVNSGKIQMKTLAEQTAKFLGWVDDYYDNLKEVITILEFIVKTEKTTD